MQIYFYYGMLAGFWLVSVIACVCSIWWSRLADRVRFLPAIILPLMVLAISYFGITRFRFNTTTTVNGVVTWRFDSKWAFETTLILGAISLVYAIWKRVKLRGGE